MELNAVDLIIAKREGLSISPKDLGRLIDAYTSGEIEDYQMSAFLMAAFLNGMDRNETDALTSSMLHSGRIVDLSNISGIKVDKHSTGGVGDKVSILLAPIVASCSVPVPMISGRGLAHSGGTLDKLESIPGFNVNLSIEAYRKQVEDIGVVMVGQTREIAPADRKIYALRDVTGTVESISFIASSIMSKKLAEGIDALVLDVKCGKGAFMKTKEEADQLARSLIEIGNTFGKSVVAWMTSMDQPLGRAVGNWVEVEESIRCLQGESVDDLMELTFTLASEMLLLGEAVDTLEAGRIMAKEAVTSGRAFDKFAQLVERQGGDPDVIIEPKKRKGPSVQYEVHAMEEGIVSSLDAFEIGRAALHLGAGRLKKASRVDPTAGIFLRKKEGESVRSGDVLATMYTSRTVECESIARQIRGAYILSDAAYEPSPLLIKRYAYSAS